MKSTIDDKERNMDQIWVRPRENVAGGIRGKFRNQALPQCVLFIGQNMNLIKHFYKKMSLAYALNTDFILVTHTCPAM